MFDGGYYLIKQDLIHTGLHKHTAATPEAVSFEMLEAVNIVQATPWVINTWALDLMRECWVSGQSAGTLPSADDEPLPPRVPDDVWARLSKAERAGHKYQRSKVHEHNAKLQGKREAFLRKINIADQLRDEAAIYFPHFLDFRGRIYPMPQDLNPQGDDVARALLMFAEGKPLGPRGLFWLAIRLANTFGEDKRSFDDRLIWVVEHEHLIEDSALRPLDGERFWMDAEEPWSFLVTCREWAAAHASENPQEFLSHLPVPLDGSCNGLQHLSLMGRDPVGARATNCTSSDERNDLYEEVATVVRGMVAADAAAGVSEAAHWLARGIDRKVVKRAVMTMPYGVTPRGIRDQLIADGFCSGMDGHTGANADYMQEKISAALGLTVQAAKTIMAYFQAVAGRLADANLPLRWLTPAGLEVTQFYWKHEQYRVTTLFGETYLWRECPEMGINRRKQILASAPNIVHSFDAAMLALTVRRCHREYGMTAFAFIHDSYGTYAADTDLLSETLRAVAAEMYVPDRLAEFGAYVQSYAPNVALPAPPPRGDFDVREVKSAPYFFA